MYALIFAGPIDNSDIQGMFIEDDLRKRHFYLVSKMLTGPLLIELKAGLIEKYDYVLIPADAYLKLLGTKYIDLAYNYYWASFCFRGFIFAGWYGGDLHFEREVIDAGTATQVIIYECFLFDNSFLVISPRLVICQICESVEVNPVLVRYFYCDAATGVFTLPVKPFAYAHFRLFSFITILKLWYFHYVCRVLQECKVIWHHGKLL